MFKIQIFKITDYKLDEPDSEIVHRGHGVVLEEKIKNLSKYYNAKALEEKIFSLFKPYLGSQTWCMIYIKLLNPFAERGYGTEFKKLVFSYNPFTTNKPEGIRIQLKTAIRDSVMALEDYISGLEFNDS